MISVIVPIYNAAQYLKQCIESILSQSFRNFELILINDGSTDNSLKICKEYAFRDDRIKVIDSQNEGVSASRNKGLNVAIGEWIIFADSDDYFLENAFQILYDRAMQTGTDLVFANSMKVEEGEYRMLHKLKNEVLPNVICSIQHFAVWGYLFNAKIIHKNNLRFINGLAYSEDRIFIYQIAQYCKTIAYCDKPIYVYRINEASVCSSRDGVRKACQHIDASYYLSQLADSYKNTDKITYRYLSKQSRHVVKLGLYLFVETGISWKNLIQVKDKYVQRFGEKMQVLLFFYYNIVRSLITNERRKIIKFKK